MEEGARVAAAVLAAGRGSRLGHGVTKPLLPFRGRPLVDHVLDAVTGSGLRPVLLVVGYDGPSVVEAVADRGPNVEAVWNARWSEGISTSLGVALASLDTRPDIYSAVIGLADQPLVGPEAWRRVGDAMARGAQIAVATYGGQRANPVGLARSVWPEAQALRGDEGARQLFRDHDVVEVPCDGAGSPDDIDTSEDLLRIRDGVDPGPQ